MVKENKFLNGIKQLLNPARYQKGTPDAKNPGDAKKVVWSTNASSWMPESSLVQSIQDYIANDIATQTFLHETIDTKTMVRHNRVNSKIYYVLNMSLKNRVEETVNGVTGVTQITSSMTSTEFWTEAMKRMLRTGWVYIQPIYDTSDGSYAANALSDLKILDSRPDDLTDVIAIKSPYSLGVQAKQLMNRAFEAFWADINSDDVKGYLKVNGQIDQKGKRFDESMSETIDAFYRYVKDYRIGVIDNKSDYHELNNDYRKIKPEDLELLENEVYAIFGVSKDVIAGTADAQQMAEYKEKVIKPINKQIKTELNRVLLSPYLRDLSEEKDTIEHISIYEDVYQYVTPSEKAQLIQQATNAGIATRNELRSIIGLPPEENGDELVTNLNNVRIGSDNNSDSGTNNGSDS